MEFLLLFLLILTNGLFAMSELAIVASRKSRLREAASSGSASAQTALKLAENPDTFLSTIQVAITLIGIVSGTLGGSQFIQPLAAWLASLSYLQPVSLQLATLLVVGSLTYLTLVFGELVPKRVALGRPEAVAMRVAPLMLLVSRLTRPLVRILSLSTGLLVRLIPGTQAKELPITEDELKLLVSEGTRAGVFRATEHELLHRVLELEDLSVSKLMVPRPKIAWLDASGEAGQNVERIRAGHHSRFPVCDGQLDRVLGVSLARNLLLRNLESPNSGLGLRKDDLLPALFFPQHLSVLAVLERFRSSKVHLGLVVDEHGCIRGLITVNDILEALVGELVVEGGQELSLCFEQEDGSWLLDGLLPIVELHRLLDRELEASEAGYTTLAGFVIERMGRIPEPGEAFRAHGRRFEILSLEGHRVGQVRMSLEN